MGFFPSYFLCYPFIHTQKVYNVIPCCLSRFGKDLIFKLSYFKERMETFDEGAINLERQTHFNEM